MVVLTYILAAVVLLGFCIFVHELGHLLGGMMVGIKAKVFSMGYGKGILKKKIGDTTYQITPIPFGGYCKFYGEDPEEERVGKEFEFLSAAPWRRIVTVVMGPIFNLIFGILIFLMMNLIGYSTETNKVIIPAELKKGKSISAAYKTGIRSGDRILEINSRKILGFSGIQSKVLFSDGKELKIKVDRDGKKLDFKVKPKFSKISGRYNIGVMPYGKRILIAGFSDDNSEAKKAGIKEFDEIKSYDGIAAENLSKFIKYINSHSNKKVKVKVVRKGKAIDITVTPRLKEVVLLKVSSKKGSKASELVLHPKLFQNITKDKFIKIDGKLVREYKDLLAVVKGTSNKKIVIEKKGKVEIRGIASYDRRGYIGIYPTIAPEMVEVKYGFAGALAQAFIEPYEFIVMNIKGMGMLFSGKMNVRENLSGPIRIAKIAGDVAYYKGISAFIILMAKISIILMVMNLLPIPMVDGSHIIFFLVEIIRRKPMSQKVMERIQTVGFAILLMIFAFVIINDISMLPFVQNLFK
ncbi:RIP metalloprotease RseP [Spirochaetota bacterium]